MNQRSRFLAVGLLTVFSILPVFGIGQDKPADPVLTLDRIFVSRDFAPERFGPACWMADGESYTTLEPSMEAKPGRDLVLYWAESGKREVLVSATRLVPSAGAVTATPKKGR